jgi:3-oxoacyl-[acyl-carrier-protein] synthase II
MVAAAVTLSRIDPAYNHVVGTYALVGLVVFNLKLWQGRASGFDLVLPLSFLVPALWILESGTADIVPYLSIVFFATTAGACGLQLVLRRPAVFREDERVGENYLDTAVRGLVAIVCAVLSLAWMPDPRYLAVPFALVLAFRLATPLRRLVYPWALSAFGREAAAGRKPETGEARPGYTPARAAVLAASVGLAALVGQGLVFTGTRYDLTIPEPYRLPHDLLQERRAELEAHVAQPPGSLDVEALTELGFVLHDLGLSDRPALARAEQVLRRAMFLDPAHAQAVAWYGSTLAAGALYEQRPIERTQLVAAGLAELDRAVRLSPDDPLVRLARASVCLGLPAFIGRLPTAREDIDRLLELARTHPAGRRHLRIARPARKGARVLAGGPRGAARCLAALPAGGRQPRAPFRRERRAACRGDRGRYGGAAVTPDARRVVVTGMGVVSPIGVDRESFWRAALEGRNGVRPLEFLEMPRGRRIFGGQVPAKALDDRFDAAQEQRLSAPARFGLAAAQEALEQAGLARPADAGIDPWRFGVCLGSGTGNPRQVGAAAIVWSERGLGGVPRRVLWKTPATSVTATLAEAFDLRGPNALFTTSCMAGNNAIAYAADLLAAGRADVMLTGGAEAMSWVVSNGFRMLTTVKGQDLALSQPFCAERRGVIIGEGAGVLVLETLAHARARGARAYAEVLGTGFASDAHHASTPHPEGAGGLAAVYQSLERAGLPADALDYVSAHGTGSQTNDVVETRIFKTVLGARARHVPISSLKSMLGHSLGAASAIEAIACVLAIRDARVPPTINYTTPDPECDLDYVPNVARTHWVDVALSTAFAFGGSCSSIVLARPRGSRSAA